MVASIERKSILGVVLFGLVGAGALIYGEYSQNQGKMLRNEKCREILFVEKSEDLSGYLQNKDFRESDLISYIIEINNLKDSDPTPYGRNLFFPVYSEKRCKEIEAERPKTYNDIIKGMYRKS